MTTPAVLSQITTGGSAHCEMKMFGEGGDRLHFHVAQFTPGSDYAADGFAVDFSDYFRSIDFVAPIAVPGSLLVYYVPDSPNITGKLKFLVADTGVEVADHQDYSTSIFYLLVCGRV